MSHCWTAHCWIVSRSIYALNLRLFIKWASPCVQITNKKKYIIGRYPASTLWQAHITEKMAITIDRIGYNRYAFCPSFMTRNYRICVSWNPKLGNYIFFPRLSIGSWLRKNKMYKLDPLCLESQTSSLASIPQAAFCFKVLARFSDSRQA